MNIPKDEYCQDAIVNRMTDSGYDEYGQWHEGGDVKIATITGADIQPLSWRQRAAGASGTNYDSDHQLFAGSEDIGFESGYTELLVNDMVVWKSKTYRIVFPGNWGSHYESYLKLEAMNNQPEIPEEVPDEN